MPQRIKYVGPKDEKTFRGFHFIRDVSDDASGGLNAIEVPDNVANAALKHRDVFLQWNRPVPAEVKALRNQLPEALEKEAAVSVKHWSRRLAVAETLPEDSKKQKDRKAEEIAGARRQVEDAMAKLRSALATKAERRAEFIKAGKPVPDVLLDRPYVEAPSTAAELAAELARLQAALDAKDVELVSLREEIIGDHERQEADAEATAQAQAETVALAEEAQSLEEVEPAPSPEPSLEAETQAPEPQAPEPATNGRPTANRRRGGQQPEG